MSIYIVFRLEHWLHWNIGFDKDEDTEEFYIQTPLIYLSIEV